MCALTCTSRAGAGAARRSPPSTASARSRPTSVSPSSSRPSPIEPSSSRSARPSANGTMRLPSPASPGIVRAVPAARASPNGRSSTFGTASTSSSKGSTARIAHGRLESNVVSEPSVRTSRRSSWLISQRPRRRTCSWSCSGSRAAIPPGVRRQSFGVAVDAARRRSTAARARPSARRTARSRGGGSPSGRSSARPPPAIPRSAPPAPSTRCRTPATWVHRTGRPLLSKDCSLSRQDTARRPRPTVGCQFPAWRRESMSEVGTRPVPPGLTERDVDDAIERLTAELGAEKVITDPAGAARVPRPVPGPDVRRLRGLRGRHAHDRGGDPGDRRDRQRDEGPALDPRPGPQQRLRRPRPARERARSSSRCAT